MKQQFDFNSVGKHLPYQVPDRFFDKMHAQLLKEADAISKEIPTRTTRTFSRTRHRQMIFLFASVTAACIAFVLVFNVYMRPEQSVQEDTMTSEQAYSKLTEEDRKAVIICYQDDIFLQDKASSVEPL